MVVAAMVSAGLLLALAGKAREAEATFPGGNGKILFESGRATGEGVDNPTRDFEIFTIDPDGTGLTQLTTNTANDSSAVWSADGEKIAFQTTRDGDFEIYTMNADGTQQSNLTRNGAAFDAAPAFAPDPDGGKVAFTSSRTTGEGVDNPEGDLEVFTVNLDGTGLTQLTKNAENDFDSDFSPDGERIAFLSDRDGNVEVYSMESDGAQQTNLTRNDAADEFPSWSPDGERITFTSDRDGDFEVYTMKADGSRQTRRTNNSATDSVPIFSPNGKKLAFTSDRGDDFDVYAMKSDGSKPKRVTDNPDEDPASDFPSGWQPLE